MKRLETYIETSKKLRIAPPAPRKNFRRYRQLLKDSSRRFGAESAKIFAKNFSNIFGLITEEDIDDPASHYNYCKNLMGATLKAGIPLNDIRLKHISFEQLEQIVEYVNHQGMNASDAIQRVMMDQPRSADGSPPLIFR